MERWTTCLLPVHMELDRHDADRIFYLLHSSYSDEEICRLFLLFPLGSALFFFIAVDGGIHFWEQVCYVQMLTDPISRNLELPLSEDQIFVDFSNLSTLTRTYVRRCAITILMCLMSVLKYMRHSQTYGTLAITLTYAGAEIVRFLLVFSLVNLTFTVMGMLMFGNTLKDFHTVSASIQTLMMMMTGEYGYQSLQSVNEVSAMTFYSFYVILVFFILVNMCESRLPQLWMPRCPIHR